MRRKNYGLTALALSTALIMSACGTSVPATSAASETAASEASGRSSDSETKAETHAAEDSEKATESAEYISKLFDTSYVHTIDIEIEEADWEDLLANPTDKTKYKVNVTIDGEEVNEVALSTKGNTSLSSIASDDTTDRYSFKLNFGKYVDDQTYYGLDKLNLNNIYADATYVKDYLSYQLFNYMDVDAPLTSFINVTVNGESQGLYLAIEDIDDSFLDRTGNSEGELYKPETAGLANMGNGGPGKDGMQPPEGFDGQMPDFGGKGGRPDRKQENFDGQMPDLGGKGGRPDGTQENSDGQMPDFGGKSGRPDGTQENSDGQLPDFGNGEMPEGFGGPGGFGGNDSGASLKYTDDEIESYSDIFDNAETKVKEEDQKRLIAALKNLSEGNVSDSVDIDSVINYFVVHNFVMNYDSYTGNMLHNYYLYEEDGKLQMIPWDYNLAFGAFMNMGGGPKGNPFDNKDQNDDSTEKNSENNATYIINYGIDTPLSGAQESDRPMWSWITSSDEYLEKYHERFAELAEYVTSEAFTAELDRLYEMLLPYVEKDATAFYTADEFKTAFDTIKEFITLRAESIKKQLAGELSTKTDEQDESAKVDASGITISDMGSQGGGAPRDNRGGESGRDGKNRRGPGGDRGGRTEN
ncbi:CotH protein [Lachnospiraceae bacterium JC7]|nr:CotH protein [Lachnospiraceae bacterium JC7]